jgi:imidazolonepropionase-like amidohydrolase
VASDSDKARVWKLVLGGVVLAKVAAAGYLAAKVRSVRAGLSEPRSPFDWKPERGRSVFLKGANVVDVKRGQVLRERGVVFRDGAIVEVVGTRDLDKVNADRTFDCGGLFLIPGLINCHVHVLMPGAALIDLPLILSVKRQAVRNLEDCPVNGVTTIRDASACSKVLNDLAQAVERLEVLGPRVVGCGASLKARGGYPEFTKQLPGFLSNKIGDMALYVDSPESGREAVRRSVEQGARFIKLFFDDRSLFYGHKPLPVIDDESVRAIVDEAHRLGRRVGVHQSQIEGFRRAVRLGVDDFEHVPIDEFLEPADIKAFMAGEHHVTPTVSVGMALGIARKDHPARSEPLVEAMQAERERLLHQLSPAFSEPAVLKSNTKLVSLYVDGKAETVRGFKKMFDPDLYLDSFEKKNPNIRMLYEAGATICCGNDGGTPMGWPGMLFEEMELLEWFGISRIDILRAATINGARLLDMESELGSIEPGKHADMVLLSADPTKDIKAVERVEAVFRSGVLLYRGAGFEMAGAAGGD